MKPWTFFQSRTTGRVYRVANIARRAYLENPAFVEVDVTRKEES